MVDSTAVSTSFPLGSHRVRFAGATNIGRKREHNEDSIALPTSIRLAIVADGMGGHSSGDVASRLAVDTVSDYFESTAEQRTFAEGCEVVVLDERGQVVAEQKGGFVRGDPTTVNNFPLPPGTYTVRTTVAGEPAKDERVTVTVGGRTRVNFGQPSADGQMTCGGGKCG